MADLHSSSQESLRTEAVPPDVDSSASFAMPEGMDSNPQNPDAPMGAALASNNAPRLLSVRARVLAVFLAVVVSLMTWNEASIKELRSYIVDDSTPMAELPVDDGQTVEEEEPDPYAEYLPEGLVTADQVVPQAQAGINVAEVLAAQEAAGSTEVPGADATPSQRLSAAAAFTAQAPADDPEAQAQNQATADQANLLAGRFAYTAQGEDALSAPYVENTATDLSQAPTVFFAGEGAQVGIDVSLGNLAQTLAGGHLGGADPSDAVVLTYDAPYLYTDAEGNLVQTASYEEWTAQGGPEAGMRAALFGELPAGWTVYTKHGRASYLKRTAKELEAGLSGRVVLRYEGAQDANGVTVPETRGWLDGSAQMPRLSAALMGAIPATEMVTVKAGYQIASFSGAVAEDGSRPDGVAACNIQDDSAAAITLVNASAPAALTAQVGRVGDLRLNDGRAFATYVAAVNAGSGVFAPQSITVSLSDLPDADGLGSMDASGIVAFNAAGFNEAELAAIDPSDENALDALGVEFAQVEQTGEGSATFTLTQSGARADGTPEERAHATGILGYMDGLPLVADDASSAELPKIWDYIYIAVPYNAGALVRDEGAEENIYIGTDLTFDIITTLEVPFLVPTVPDAENAAAPEAPEPSNVWADAVWETTDTQRVVFLAPEPEPGFDAEEPIDDADENEPVIDEEPEGEGAENENADEVADEPLNENENADENANLGEDANDTINAGEEANENANGNEAGGEDDIDYIEDLDESDPDSVVPLMVPATLDAFVDGTADVADVDPVALSLYTMSASLPQESGIMLMSAAPSVRGPRPLEANLWNPNLNLTGLSNHLGDNVYLVNDQDNPVIVLGIDFGTSTGWFGGYGNYKTEDYENGLLNDDQLFNAYFEYATELDLEVPYLYQAYNATSMTYDGGMNETLFYPTWASNKIPGDIKGGYGIATSDTPNVGRYLSVTIDPSVLNYWYVYLIDGQNNKIDLNNVVAAGGGADVCKTEIVEKQNHPEYEGVDFSNGYTGRLRFIWHGPQPRQGEDQNPTGLTWRMEPDSYGTAAPVCKVNINGDIPENAGGSIRYGGRTRSYNNGSNIWYLPKNTSNQVKWGNTLEAKVGEDESGAGALRRITFLKTNLKWNTTYEVISDNVMYDRYNYMVYKVTTKNESIGTADIDTLYYNLTVHGSDANRGEGLTKEDNMTWIYSNGQVRRNTEYSADDGSIVKVKNMNLDVEQPENPGEEGATTNRQQFIGVPNKGGALIYNVSNWTDEHFAKLDMVKFSNIDEIIAEANGEAYTPPALGENEYYTQSIPYQTNGSDRSIIFTVNEANGGHLYPDQVVEERKNLDENDPAHSSVTFLVAVPYTTNITATTGLKNGKTFQGYYVGLDPVTTIYFGGKGVNNYAWSKRNETGKITYPFGRPQTGLSMKKYVLENGTKEVNFTSSTSIGYPATYELTEFKTTGNMPLYGSDTNNEAWGPEIMDTLPKYFRLQNIEFDVTDGNDLSRYFNTNKTTFTGKTDFLESLTYEGSVVQLQIALPNPATSTDDYYWMNIGEPDLVNTDGDTKTYRLGGTFGNQGIADMLENRNVGTFTNGINPLPGVTKSGYNFTGLMRIVMRAPLAQTQTVPVKIRINGTLVLPGYEYTNNAVTNYGQRVWVASSTNPGYQSQSGTSNKVSAGFNSVVAPRPTMTANAIYSADDKLFDTASNVVLTGNTKPILNRPGAGWRFTLGNTSASKMEPGKFTLGTVFGAGLTQPAGFNAERVGMNQSLLNHMDIAAIEIAYKADDNPANWVKGTVRYDNSGADGTRSLDDFLNTYKVTKDDGSGKLVDDGLCITRDAWNNGYLMSVTVYFDSFDSNKEINPSERLMVEIMGTPEELATMKLDGSVTTSYENIHPTLAPSNVSASASAQFETMKAPYVLQTSMIAFREALQAGDTKAITGTASNFEGYIGDPGSGWRINVANDSNYAIGSAIIRGGQKFKTTNSSIKTLEKGIEWKYDGRLNFETQSINISPKLYKPMNDSRQAVDPGTDPNAVLRGGVLGDLTVYYYDADGNKYNTRTTYGVDEVLRTSSSDTSPSLKAFVVEGKYLRAATDTLTDADIAAGAPTKAEAAAHGVTVDDNGYVIVSATGWPEDAIMYAFDLEFSNFGAGLKLSDNAFVEVYGTVRNQRQLNFGSVFGTNYVKDSWNASVQTQGWLQGNPYPAKPEPTIYASADLASEKQYETGTAPQWTSPPQGRYLPDL